MDDPLREKTLRLLEFDRLRAQVAERALSGEAARRLLEEAPLDDPREVETIKALVAAFAGRLNSGDAEPGDLLPDIGGILPKLDVEGTSLALDEAYGLGIFITRAGALTAWSVRGGEPLAGLVSKLPDCGPVSREIFRVVDREGRLRDLPEFREIQDRIRRLTRELEAVTAGYTGNEETRRMLQSPLPSQRDGRMVLAVKANYRGRLKGIVHEVSSSGQTVFVEPGEVVEKNNEILIENRRLEAEIHRVLREMTRRAAEHRHALKEFHGGILYLETLRARARYGYETGSRFAMAAEHRDHGSPGGAGPVLALKQARHPLLGIRAVPIDLVLDVRTVIITGPNTGGKTAALKTLGLFALMNQWGLALPAEEAILPVFDGVYADIGDEQSLSQSLSTFSAHMTNIAAITERAGGRSLVLLDELGSGTDPEEGSAIAMAILDYLIGKKVCLIATTHHGILKNYGYTREGVENASAEFDSLTLAPTFRIIMGIPGESRAVDIAERNGLPAPIVRAARVYLDEERSDVSALITGLKEKHRELDAAAEARKNETLRLREDRRRADLRELALRQKERDLKAGAVGNLRLLLNESRKTLENLVREVKEGELSREKTVKVKEFLRNLEEDVTAGDAALAEESRALSEDRRRLDEAVPEYAAPESSHARDRPIPIRPGIEVLAGEHRRQGRVLRADKKAASGHASWIVEIGSLKMSFPEEDLFPLPPAGEMRKPQIAVPELNPETQAQFELNLLGMRLEEALDRLRRQIDAATLAGLREK